MDSIRLRRYTALLGSAALLASMTVATVAAPASAGKCLPFPENALNSGADCYYATEPVVIGGVPPGVTLSGTNERDLVFGSVEGTFNGRGGNDIVGVVDEGGTYNGGKGDDLAEFVVGEGATFNGGPGDDVVFWEVYGDGTFNGGPGDDCADNVGRRGIGASDGTFAGGGGSDTYRWLVRGDVWSAEPNGALSGPSCPFPS